MSTILNDIEADRKMLRHEHLAGHVKIQPDSYLLAQLAERIDRAIDLIEEYNYVDKQWLIDKVVQELKGDKYPEWVKAFQNKYNYPWDTGISP